ncbi:hypothetical protein [Rufibacter immobilis]|uniref:hypothetical protein n=1 Tax=Rufibacter immobilis TaxID=1348778 RepID=UPI0035E4F5B6
MKLNSKLPEFKIILFDATLNSESFQDWLQVKLNLERIEIMNAKEHVQNLFYNSKNEINGCLDERVINSLKFLLEKSFYSSKKSENLLQIVNSDKTSIEKISLLKASEPFSKPKQASISLNRHSVDSYENFNWGGLNGEEAYTGYWNTD